MNICVVGGGSWGNTLADIVANNGHNVMIYERNVERCELINTTHTNPNFTEYKINESIKATPKLEEGLDFGEVVVLAVPSSAMRGLLMKINEINISPKLFVNVAKGIEPDTLKTISQIFYEVMSEDHYSGFVTLSGPSLAKEVMRKKITLLTAASINLKDAELVQNLFSNQEYVRVYRSVDLVGVEINGSVKNAIALISGILDGLNLGENARAALICRGLQELAKINQVYGGNVKTLYGLSGVGDLIVTSVSEKSRNFQAGKAVAQGAKITDLIENAKEVIEGPRTITSCYQIAQKYQLDLPIILTAYKVLYEGLDPMFGISELMQRNLKSE